VSDVDTPFQIPEGASPGKIEALITGLLGELELAEKVAMLSGHGFTKEVAEDGRYCARMYHIGAGNERLGVPKLLFNDGPRGVAMGASTCFPVPMARGASFDTDLEQRIGSAIGREMRAHGGNLFGGVCINLLRHPAWGRAQETYGEDPFLLGELGSALTRGVQHHNVIATPKHFAANSMENARFTVDVSLDERSLREVYLPHFKRCIDAGAGAVMSAYNQLNGAYCGHNPDLLTRILKDEWGFSGFVYSDFILGCRGADACAAGLDVEAPDTYRYGDKLVDAVLEGSVDEARIDDAVRRVLRSLFGVLAAPDPETYDDSVIACAAHQALAREAAEKSLVLLRNTGVLPLDPARPRRLLVIGGLAVRANLGDHGSSHVYPPHVVTPLDGLRAACPPGWEILHDAGDDTARASALAAEVDIAVVIAGYDHRDEGEYIPTDMSGGGGGDIGGDRVDLTIGASQEALIRAVAAANANTVVALMAGSAVIIERWKDEVAAILMLWYPGMEGGHALADALFGRVNPSGHLPFSVPRRPEDLPFFDRDAQTITYDLWHGYTKLERDGVEPAFPFGFGLSYTSFAFDRTDVNLDSSAPSLRVEADVANTGERPGDAVVQVYAGLAAPVEDMPRKRLCGFSRVSLTPGETKRVAIDVALRDLARFDPDAGCWRLDAGDWRIAVGPSSSDATLVETTVGLPERRWSTSE